MNAKTSDYNVENLPPTLRQSLAEKTVFAPSGESLPLAANVTLGQAAQLYSMIRQLKPQVSVEVGLGQGFSTTAILQALADNGQGIHHVIDPYQKYFKNAGREMIKRAGLESHYVFHETFVENVVPNLPPVQFGFIDASHLFDFTIVEFVLIDKKLEAGGLVGLHDLWMPAQKKVLSYILRNRKYQIVRPQNAAPLARKTNIKRNLQKRFSRTLARLPMAEQIFNAELLHYHAHGNFDNLTILRKISDDGRDWRFHQAF